MQIVNAEIIIIVQKWAVKWSGRERWKKNRDDLEITVLWGQCLMTR